MTPLRPSGVRLTSGRVILGLALLRAAVRALRFWGPFATWAHWDETGLAVLAHEILGGSLPVHYLGVEYQGNTPSYPLAAWFALFGISTVSLDVLAYGVGLVMFWTGYLVARRILEPREALLALVVLAVAPLPLTRLSLYGSLDYPFLIILGNLFLLATHRLFFRCPETPRTILVLGLLAGIGIWTSMLFFVYAAPCGVLAIRTGLVRRPRAALFLVGGFVGGLPVWLHEVQHFPSARFMVHGVGSVGVRPPLERAGIIAGGYLPSLVGVHPEVVGFSIAGML